MMNKPWPVSKIIAHRGASAFAPENTLAALEKAHELGAEWVEADVRLTLDNEVIVFHDETLDRCTNGRGLVRRTPYAVIAELDAGSWFAAKYSHEKIPTLAQWLSTAARLKLGIILDLKGRWYEARRLADMVSVALSRYWPSQLSHPIISSGNVSCLRAVARQSLGYDLAYIVQGEKKRWVKVVEKLPCFAIHLNHEFISERWLNELKQKKVHIAAYTVNDRDRAQQLFDWGIESVFSDDPGLLTREKGHSSSGH